MEFIHRQTVVFLNFLIKLCHHYGRSLTPFVLMNIRSAFWKFFFTNYAIFHTTQCYRKQQKFHNEHPQVSGVFYQWRDSGWSLSFCTLWDQEWASPFVNTTMTLPVVLLTYFTTSSLCQPCLAFRNANFVKNNFPSTPSTLWPYFTNIPHTLYCIY